MSDMNAAPAGGAEPIAVPVSTPAQADNTSISASEAARQLSNWRYKKNNPETQAEPPAEQASAEPPHEPAQAEADPPQEAPGDTTEQQPDPVVEELPSIEPPRSWTKEEKEEFLTYPREAQEKIARREQDRETTLRRSQNEAAEKLKGLTVKEQQAEQARQQYEAALPALLQSLQEAHSGEFSDIKTMADVERLAREDWPRYALWDAQQKKLAAVAQQASTARERQVAEFKTQWATFAQKEDQALLDKAPELSDTKRAQKIADSAVNVLKDLGFTESDLASAWNGESSVSLRDHRIQLLILDAIKYREAKVTAAKPAPKPIPQVQRPGVSKPQVSGSDAEIQALAKKFERTGSIQDAKALRLAQVRARA